MTAPSFEWDLQKAAANLARHHVAFEEAATAFTDPLAMIHSDPDHSQDERRGILVGHSESGRLLLVSFAHRGSSIRIISARVPTKREREQYEEDAN
jgi:uncharacterized DUF497 family protein